MVIHVNGIDIRYEKSGSGSPMVLLHGNGEDHGIFDVLIPRLEDRFTVYALDSRGHGKSGRSPVLCYEDMAEDVAAFIRELKLEKPALFGFSDGGILGLMVASNYPGLLSRLAVAGANTNPAALRQPWRACFKLLGALTGDAGIRMMLTGPHITDEQLGRIRIPVLVLAGERDLIKKEDTVHIAAMIENSSLRILPGESHASYVVHSPKLYGYIRAFMEGEA